MAPGHVITFKQARKNRYFKNIFSFCTVTKKYKILFVIIIIFLFFIIKIITIMLQSFLNGYSFEAIK